MAEQNEDGKVIAIDRLTALHWYDSASEHGEALATAEIGELKSGRSTSCEEQDTAYSISQAVRDFPLKPGLWKIQTDFELRQSGVNHAERKTCFAETITCITKDDAYPSKASWGVAYDANGNPVPGAPSMQPITLPLQHIEYPDELVVDKRNYGDDRYRYHMIRRKIPYWEVRDSDVAEYETLDRALYYQGNCAK